MFQPINFHAEGAFGDDIHGKVAENFIRVDAAVGFTFDDQFPCHGVGAIDDQRCHLHDWGKSMEKTSVGRRKRERNLFDLARRKRWRETSADVLPFFVGHDGDHLSSVLAGYAEAPTVDEVIEIFDHHRADQVGVGDQKIRSGSIEDADHFAVASEQAQVVVGRFLR